jgi:hypothetical protein
MYVSAGRNSTISRFHNFSISWHRSADSHAAQVKLRPPPKNTRFRFVWFVSFVVNKHPIPSVLIFVHPWLKKHLSQARFAAQVELHPPPKKHAISFRVVRVFRGS